MNDDDFALYDQQDPEYHKEIDAKVRKSLEDLNKGRGIPGDKVEAYFKERRRK